MGKLSRLFVSALLTLSMTWSLTPTAALAEALASSGDAVVSGEAASSDAAPAEGSANRSHGDDVGDPVETSPSGADTDIAAVDDGQDVPSTVLVPESSQTLSVSVEADGEEGESLLESYVERRFADQLPSARRTRMRVQSAKQQLSANDARLYDLLKKRVAEIAAGSQASTQFSVSWDEIVEDMPWTAADLGVPSLVANGTISADAQAAVAERTAIDVSRVVNSLIVDCPFELYWFNKNGGVQASMSKQLSAGYSDGEYRLSVTGSITLAMAVAGEYADGGNAYLVDTSHGATVSTAVENARRIVASHAGLPAYQRLLAYKNEICALNVYNHYATTGIPYGNPWQLVWVFDGDPDTNVVCEGYAKAFKYLCDLDPIEGVGCLAVSGNMRDVTGGGDAFGHAWNVVSMPDGKNYLVDATNCDEGSVGADDLLFLVSYTMGDVEGEYGFTLQVPTGAPGVTTPYTVAYSYDPIMFQVLKRSDLVLSSTPYEMPEQGKTDLSAAVVTVDPEADLTYTGAPLTPAVTVRLADKTLAEGTDYELSYADNTSVGTATVTVTGIGAYEGTATATFEIVGNVCGECMWVVDPKGTLVIWPTNGVRGVLGSGSSSGRWAWASSDDPIRSVDIRPGVVGGTSLSGMFIGLTAISSLDLRNLDVSGVENLSFLCFGCSALTTVDLRGWDTSRVTSMENMFLACTALASVDTPSWNTPRLTSIRGMFQSCSSLTSLDLSGMDLSQVKSASDMFYDCSSLASLDLSGWKFQSPISLSGMLCRCSSLEALDMTGWQSAPVTSTADMFYDCSKLPSLDLSSFDTSRLMDTSWMFNGCSSLASLDLSAWDTSQVEQATGMFAGCSALASITVGDKYVMSNLNMFPISSAKDQLWWSMEDGAWYDILKITGSRSGIADTYRSNPVTDGWTQYGTCEWRIEGGTLTVRPLGDGESGRLPDESGTLPGARGTNNVKVTKVVFEDGVRAGTGLSELFEYCRQLQEIDLSGLDTSATTDMSYMFSNCTALTSFDVSQLDMSNVTNAYGMFEGCQSLTSLDLTGIDMGKVETMTAMFLSCQSLKSVTMSDVGTPALQDVSLLFYNCGALESIDFAALDTSSVESGHGNMFDNCEAIKTVKVGSRYAMTPSFTVTENGGYEIYSANMLPDGRWWSDKAGAWFFTDEICTDRNLVVDTYHKDERLELSEGWTKYGTCEWRVEGDTLTVRPLGNGEHGMLPADRYYPFPGTSNPSVTRVVVQPGVKANASTKGWFINCDKLEEIDLSGLDTSFTRVMSLMFNNCSSLKSLDLSGFDTSKVTDMYCMFAQCSSLESLDLSGFDTSKVTNMLCMFYQCSSLKSLDISGFDTSKVTEESLMMGIFNKCTSLEKIAVGKGYDIKSADMFPDVAITSGAWWSERDKAWYAKDEIVAGRSGIADTYTAYEVAPAKTDLSAAVVTVDSKADLIYTGEPLTPAVTVVLDGRTLAEGTDYELSYANNTNVGMATVTVTGTGAYEGTATATFEIAAATPTLTDGWTQYGTCEWRIEGDTLTVRPLGDGESGQMPDVSGTLPGSGDANVRRVVFKPGVKAGTSLAHLFEQRGRVQEIDLSGLDTSATTNMRSMFAYCYSLTSLDLSGLDTSRVMDMSRMFDSCESLTSLNLSGLDTSNVTSMNNMFVGCESLSALDLSGLDTTSLTDMAYMFWGCQSLASLDLSGFDTSHVTSMYCTFGACKALTTLDLSGFDTSNVTTMGELCACCKSLESLELGDFDMTHVKDAWGLFFECTSLRALDLSGVRNTSGVTDMGYLFADCESLTSLDLSGFDTSHVTNMGAMFRNCKALTSLDLTSFDTSRVDSVSEVGVILNGMSHMFAGCSSLRSLDISSFDTSRVPDLSHMFDGCTALESLDLSGFDTRAARNVEGMFASCDSLAELKVGERYAIASADAFPEPTSPLKRWWSEADGVWYTQDEIVANRGLVADTYRSSSEPAPTDGWTQYGTCEWRIEGDTLTVRPLGNGVSGQMPDVSGTLPGSGDANVRRVVFRPGVKAGSSLAELFRERRQIEEIDLSGLDTSATTDMSQMFWLSSSLARLDLSGLDTSHVTSMFAMFGGCFSLSSIDFTGIDTSSVTNMYGMFVECRELASLDLSGFDTSSVTSMEEMFNGCKSLRSIDLSGFDTSRVTNMRYMFVGCSSLTSLDLSGFDTSDVTDMGCMFEDCTSLVTLDLSGFDTSSIAAFNAVKIVWGLAGMFKGCTSLATLDLSSFDTAHVTSMSHMFDGCTALKTLDLSSFDTSYVFDLSHMFDGCSALESLDLSGFDTRAARDVEGMFASCDSLAELKVGERYAIASADAFPEPTSPLGKWWSEADRAWYTRDEIVAGRSGIADTYTAYEVAAPKTDLSTAVVTVDPTADLTYTGKPLTPAVTVALAGTTLAEGSDYTLSYANNTDVGTATVTATGIGAYEGTATATFEIVAAPERSSVTICVSSESALAGETVTLAVSVEDNPGILGAMLTISYDEGLTLVEAREGGALSALSMTEPGSLASPCRFVWDGVEVDDADVRDGELLLLTFTVSGDVPAGTELAVAVSGEPGAVLDGNVEALAVSYVSGGIAVVDYEPGDVDGDGIVGVRDVIFARRQIVGGYDQAVNVAAADVNADGVVNASDVILIRRFIAGGWGVTLRPSPLGRDGTPRQGIA